MPEPREALGASVLRSLNLTTTSERIPKPCIFDMNHRTRLGASPRPKPEASWGQGSKTKKRKCLKLPLMGSVGVPLKGTIRAPLKRSRRVPLKEFCKGSFKGICKGSFKGICKGSFKGGPGRVRGTHLGVSDQKPTEAQAHKLKATLHNLEIPAISR